MSDPPRQLVIGLGNPHRGDDIAGRLVARRLLDAAPPEVTVLEQDGDAASLLGWLRAQDAVWLVDAAMTGAPCGTVHRFDGTCDIALPGSATASSHGLGVAEALGLARALGCLPRRCVLYAIEGAAFAPGAVASAPVVAATAAVAAQILTELRPVKAVPSRAGGPIVPA